MLSQPCNRQQLLKAQVLTCNGKEVLLLFLCPGQLETPEAGVTYIMDVLEEAGTDVARRCFWDFGDWSDLWRETKHVPLGVSLQVGPPASNHDAGNLASCSDTVLESGTKHERCIGATPSWSNPPNVGAAVDCHERKR